MKYKTVINSSGNIMKKLCLILVMLLSVMLNGCGNKQDTVPSGNVTSKDSTVTNKPFTSAVSRTC